MSEGIYQRKNVPVFEAIYGKGFISLGGAQAVRNMFDGYNLKNKSVLDIGFGLGGLLYLIVSEYEANGIGLDTQSWMTDYALEAAPNKIQGSLKFYTYIPDCAFPLEDCSVNMVVSKGVLTNIKNKEKLFSEIYRILKPSGEILLIDWIVPDYIGQYSSVLTMGDESHKETESSYRKILEDNGFSQIRFTNVSKEYLTYVEQLDTLYRSDEHRETFKEVIDDDLRVRLTEANQKLLRSIKKGKQLACKIEASTYKRNIS